MISKEYFGEDKNIEFKRELPSRHEKFLKDIIAFSNSTGGTAILGIEDETELEGQGISYDSLQEIGREFDEKKVLELCENMKKLAVEACESQDEKATIKDMTLEKLEDFGVLCKVGRNLYPTHAFDLLTDNKNRAAKIQCALFKGLTRDVFIDRKEFCGSIQSQVDDAYKFVLRHINTGAEINGEYRKDTYEFPVTAIREMIANGVLHRSYLDRSCIQVCIFDDRIEVLSPVCFMVD